MPKNTKGGKKHKQLKNSNIRSQYSNLTLKDSSGYQFYAVVEKNYGHNADVKFIKDIHEMNEEGINVPTGERILISTKAIIRGSIAKKCRLQIGDILLISVRDYDTKKVDVIYKYSNDEIRDLNGRNEFDSEFIKLSGHFNNEGGHKDKTQLDSMEDIINHEKSYADIEFNDSEDSENENITFNSEADLDNL
jgi:translation initiation factor 1A